VAEPLIAAGFPIETARERAGELLHRLAVPERMWGLAPATFSGGEQQRVNVARGFLPDLPLLLLDEPTASLDAQNRAIVTDLIAEKKRRGVAIVAIAHDDEVRATIADTIVDVTRFAAAA
jgi:alpha-D-ribose 1-methylphosphonate 5-triphosphate synthase subunit PhnL